MVGNKLLILEALGNIVSNATSFAFEDSEIIVRVVPFENRYVGIEVENKGPLLPEGEMSELFGAFRAFRSEKNGEHYGLGLYIVSLVAERHNGWAKIENLPDLSGVRAGVYFLRVQSTE